MLAASDYSIDFVSEIGEIVFYIWLQIGSQHFCLIKSAVLKFILQQDF